MDQPDQPPIYSPPQDDKIIPPDQDSHHTTASTSATSSSKPIAVILTNCQALAHPKTGFINFGTTLSTSRDLILLSPSLSYTGMRDLLAERAIAKDMIADYHDDSSKKIYRSVAVVWSQPVVYIDEGNWEAARKILMEEKGASMKFCFAVVDVGFEEEARRRLVQERERKKMEGKWKEGKKGGKCVVQ